MILGPRVAIQCLNTAVTTTLINLNDSAAGQAAGAGEALELISGSAADAAAGTGARTVKVVYLTPAGAVAMETVTMNGSAAAVALVDTAVWRVLDMWCATFGTGLANAGAITLRTVSGSTARFSIPIGRLRAGMGQFTVPAGYEFRFHGAQISYSNITNGTPLKLFSAIEAEIDPATGSYVDGVFLPILRSTGGINRIIDYGGPPGGWGIRIPPLATIRARAATEAGTVEVAGNMWGSLVKVGDIHRGNGPDPDGVWG
jgi:hypothetical protein